MYKKTISSSQKFNNLNPQFTGKTILTEQIVRQQLGHSGIQIISVFRFLNFISFTSNTFYIKYILSYNTMSNILQIDSNSSYISTFEQALHCNKTTASIEIYLYLKSCVVLYRNQSKIILTTYSSLKREQSFIYSRHHFYITNQHNRRPYIFVKAFRFKL